MPANLSINNPESPKKIALIASNPATSATTGWPIGTWASELIHPYWTFQEKGYQVTIFTPNGGDIMIDGYSDPRDASKYSEHDFLSLGFLTSEKYSALLKGTAPISQINVADFDAIFVTGGQSPMVTFIDNSELHELVAAFYDAGKPTALVCHGTCVLLKAKSTKTGKLVVDGKTWTGFANSEEAFADAFVGMKIQPFWIEEEAKKLPNTNFVTASLFQVFAIRDGNLITGQQQYSGARAAELVVEALGV